MSREPLLQICPFLTQQCTLTPGQLAKSEQAHVKAAAAKAALKMYEDGSSLNKHVPWLDEDRPWKMDTDKVILTKINMFDEL